MISFEPAYIIGNGTSRLRIDLENLRGNGKIFGCNALYRDFTPDILVAVDMGITKEIEKSGYQRSHPFYCRRPGPDSHQLPHKTKMASGPYATYLAALWGHKKIYLLGFDLVGLEGNRVNNVYTGTSHYRLPENVAAKHQPWVGQFIRIMTQFPDIELIRVGDDLYQPPEWADYPQYKTMGVDEFLESLNTQQEE